MRREMRSDQNAADATSGTVNAVTTQSPVVTAVSTVTIAVTMAVMIRIWRSFHIVPVIVEPALDEVKLPASGAAARAAPAGPRGESEATIEDFTLRVEPSRPADIP
jgi:hypothetical protein